MLFHFVSSLTGETNVLTSCLRCTIFRLPYSVTLLQPLAKHALSEGAVSPRLLCFLVAHRDKIFLPNINLSIIY